MIRNVSVHRADERDVVDALRDRGKEFADLDAALAIFLELERRWKGGAGFAFDGAGGGCIVSAGAAAVAPLLPAGCIAGSFGAISSAMLLSERLRRSGGLVSDEAGGCAGVSVAAPCEDLAAASRACWISN